MLDKKVPICEHYELTVMFELFSVELVGQYLSRSSVLSWRQQKSSAKILPAHVEEHDVSLFWFPLCDMLLTYRHKWHIQKARVKYRICRISCYLWNIFNPLSNIVFRSEMFLSSSYQVVVVVAPPPPPPDLPPCCLRRPDGAMKLANCFPVYRRKQRISAIVIKCPTIA